MGEREKIIQCRKSLQEAEKRLLEVQTYGDKVISIHDLRNGYDANFVLNKCPMLKNSVIYHQNKLAELTKNQLSLF